MQGEDDLIDAEPEDQRASALPVPVGREPNWLEVVNTRIDKALLDNRREAATAVKMSAGIFILGVGIILVAYWQKNPYFLTGGLLSQGLLYWPVHKILQIRRENLILQTLPAFLTALPIGEAVKLLKKVLLERLWKA